MSTSRSIGRRPLSWHGAIRSSTAQLALGLSTGDPSSGVGDDAACHEVGAAAHQLGLTGIIAPAASCLRETPALFPTNLAIEHWPTVTARDIWHGLPADPRRLRVVDEDAG